VEPVTLDGHSSSPVALTALEDLGVPLLMAVEFAPLSLTSVTGRSDGLLSWGDPTGTAAFLLGFDPAGRPTVELRDGQQHATVTGTDSLRLGTWSAFALLVTGRSVELYVDGCPTEAAEWLGGLPATRGQGVLGARYDTAYVEGAIPAEAVSGSLGRLTAESFADEEAARAAARSHVAPAARELDVVAALARLAKADRHRPGYHFMPPAHWMNEPHGAIEVDGIHHVFYQANRKGPFWGGIEWGHAVSADLVRWTHLPPALTPTGNPVAPDGIWSGSSVLDDDGSPVLYFTAGDAGQRPDQSVARAVVRRGPGGPVGWMADAAPLLRMPEEPGLPLVPGQFRDPFVWREGRDWFMLVGVGIRERGGAALLYASEDGVEWCLRGPLLTGDLAAHPQVGEMWELPVLLPVKAEDGTTLHVLCVCPWWTAVPADRVVEVQYWVGEWDPRAGTFRPTHDEPRRLDYGRHFTGPSGTVLADGRTILWSIAQDGRTTEAHLDAGWAHNAGLPLELSLGRDGDLRLRPVVEVARLRAEEMVMLEALTPAQAAVELKGVSGRHVELDVVAGLGSADALTLSFYVDTAGRPCATVTVDVASGTLTLQRPGAEDYDSWSPATHDSGPLSMTEGDVHIHAFVDASMLAVYVNSHRALTTRVYAPEGATGLHISGTPGARLRHLHVWRLETT
jgi:sucrose-6-phosphate hydrolase SacC (GH32 family)